MAILDMRTVKRRNVAATQWLIYWTNSSLVDAIGNMLKNYNKGFLIYFEDKGHIWGGGSTIMWRIKIGALWVNMFCLM